MPRIAAHTRHELHQVLSHWGITAPGLHDIRSGRVNKHWRVEAGANRYALRRYNPHRSPDAIRYEHDVLRHMKRKGWPVAVPLRTEDGSTIVSENNSSDARASAYSLFPFLPGRPGLPHSPRYLRIKGGLLARLHGDLASLPSKGQRDGFGRLSDLDAYVPRFPASQKNAQRSSKPGRSLATFDAVLDEYAKEQPRLAEQIQAAREHGLDELARLGYESFPDTLVHGDFHTENIFFQRRRLTAILDFDLVHMDTRIADFALAIVGDCAEPPAYTAIDPVSVKAFVAAYHTESPLTAPEVRLIVPMIRAYYVWLCSFSIFRWLDGHPKGALGPARTVDQRLPNLEARAAAIERALRHAT
ncbi:MAG: phosphotransferase [Chloroflexi bacterium]|nr:phosphotransferase [Chloroflexota bacterium]